MKFNARLFSSAQGEPVEVQEIDGVKLEIYSLNSSVYFNQYASKGSFVIWSSDGVSYRLFIEDLYYKYNSEYYCKDINKIWIDVYAALSKVQKKVQWLANGIMLGIILVVMLIFAIWFQQQMLYGFIGIFAVFFISNSVESNYLRKQIETLRLNAARSIKEYLGESGYQEMIKNTENHYKEFFNLDSEGNTIIKEEVTEESQTSTLIDTEFVGEQEKEENVEVDSSVVEETKEVENVEVDNSVVEETAVVIEETKEEENK